VDIPHVRVELVLPWEWTFFTEEVTAAIAAGDCAPELPCWLVDGVTVTTQVRLPCESLRAAWPITVDLLELSALLAAE
jgi:hypothetical protein